MEFLNYVIQLPDEEINADNKNEKLEDLFHKELKNFFERIED